MTYLFVLPELDAAAGDHYIHSQGLAAAMARCDSVQPSIVVLKPAASPVQHGTVVTRYLARMRLRRGLSLLRILLALRARDTVFVRISPYALLLAVIASRLRRFRVVFWHATWKPGIARDARRSELVMRFAIRRVDRFVTYPSVMAEYYVNEFGVRRDRVRLVPNNVETSHARARAWPLPGSGARVLFAGRLSERKGAADLPAIAAELRAQSGSAVEIVVAGTGPTALDGTPGLTLIGEVPNAELLNLISQSDVVIKPSYEEGCSRVLQEAMTLGIPLVTYDIPPSRELLGSAAADCCVPVGSHELFARRIIEMLRLDDEGRARLTRRLHAIAIDFRSDAVAMSLCAATLDDP